ncbi:hypothetical protein DL764_008313 [Monosporascus ibericus]|uniref:RNA ligase domain-containing protein n=1 Tax=Monosporascus ibericus TaxID=155417 RepID=A0A4Q4SXV8_9PEZI|nr:hypothetical protein DL764_008313 [Monosporascus ibericus]
MDDEKRYLVRTIMSGRHISQGLVFPLETFSEITSVFDALKNEYPEDEATRTLMTMSFEKELGAKKWEMPQTNPESVLGPAPVFFPQPGCSRVQNIPDLFEDHGESRFQITEKLDGIPMSVYCIDKESQWYNALPALPAHLEQDGPKRVGISARREDLVDDDNSWHWITARHQGILDKIVTLSTEVGNVAIQGELCGSSIYTNSMGFAPGEHHFYVFDIYDIDRQKWMKPTRVSNFCKKLKMDHVPVVGKDVKLSSFVTDIEDLLAKAEGRGDVGAQQPDSSSSRQDAESATMASSPSQAPASTQAEAPPSATS